MDHDPTETSAGAPQVPVGRAGRSVFVPAPIDEATPAPPAHLGDDRDRGGSDGGGRRRRWVLPLVLVPLLLVVITVIAWALDTNAGNVARNVQLAGTDVGENGRASCRESGCQYV